MLGITRKIKCSNYQHDFWNISQNINFRRQLQWYSWIISPCHFRPISLLFWSKMKWWLIRRDYCWWDMSVFYSRSNLIWLPRILKEGGGMISLSLFYHFIASWGKSIAHSRLMISLVLFSHFTDLWHWQVDGSINQPWNLVGFIFTFLILRWCETWLSCLISQNIQEDFAIGYDYKIHNLVHITKIITSPTHFV